MITGARFVWIITSPSVTRMCARDLGWVGKILLRIKIINVVIHERYVISTSKTVIVGSAIGLHARPAAIIAEAVVNAGVPVTLSADDGEPVDAGSALMIMTLGAANGASVTVESDDPDALATAAGLIEQDLNA